MKLRVAAVRSVPPLLALLAAATLGCKPDPAPTPAPPTSTASAPRDASGPPTVALPTGACRLTSSSPLHGVPLRLDAAGPPYATAGHNLAAMGSLGSDEVQRTPTFAVEVIVPDGPAAPLGVRYQTDQLTVVGLVDPDDLELHPARAELTGGFLIASRVRITKVTGEQAEIEAVLGPGIERLDAGPAVTVACRELSLDEPDQPLALAPSRPDGNPRLALRPGAPIDLAVEPGGPAVARLQPGERDLVDVLEVRGASTRILWYRASEIAFGWVASTSLDQPERGTSKETRSMGISGPRFEALASVRCGHDVPLSADLGGVRTRIGAVRAEAVIEIAERAGAAARIHPSRPRIGASLDVVPAPGATFWVDDRALADCAAAPPEPAEDFGIDLGNFTGLPGPKKP